MLEFIVLGQVPGTRFVITFSWFLVIAIVAIGASTFHHKYKHSLHDNQAGLEEISL